MTAEDDFDLAELGSALDRAAPRPDPAVRAAHMALARDVFDRLHRATPPARVAQGPEREPERRGARGARARGWLAGLFATGGGLTAITAVAAGAFLILTPLGRGLVERPFTLDEGETAAALPPAALDRAAVAAEAEAPTMAEDAVEAEAAPAVDGAGEDYAAAVAAPESAPEPAPGAGNMEADVAEAETSAAPPPAPAPAPPPLAEIAEAVPPAAAPEAMAAGGGVQGMAALAPPGGEAGAATEGAETAPAGGAARGLEALAEGLVAAAPAGAGPEGEPVRSAGEAPLSDLALGAGTGAWDAVAEALRAGTPPAPGAVRIGEILAEADAAARGAVAVLPAPWDASRRLVVIPLPADLPEGARDLRLRVEWDPAAVEGWRLLALGTEDGPAAVYEVTPRGPAEAPLGTLRLRWKPPQAGGRGVLEAPVAGPETAEARLAAALAGWGLLLRGEALEGWTVADALALAQAGPEGRGGEVLDLMRESAPLLP